MSSSVLGNTSGLLRRTRVRNFMCFFRVCLALRYALKVKSPLVKHPLTSPQHSHCYSARSVSSGLELKKARRERGLKVDAVQNAKRTRYAFYNLQTAAQFTLQDFWCVFGVCLVYVRMRFECTRRIAASSTCDEVNGCVVSIEYKSSRYMLNFLISLLCPLKVDGFHA